jgi:hypothetical protein
MTEWPEPTEQQLDQVLGRLGDQQHRRHFFERLENPRWLRHLRDRGVFATPPRPWIDAEGQTRLPAWPEAGYLARMAPHEPQLAVEIVRTAGSTTNSLVHRDFIEVALAVPTDLSVQLAPLVREWLNSPSADWLNAHRLAELVAHLARGGHVKAAHRLATQLILMRVNAGSPARAAGRRYTRATKDVSTWLEPYAYADVLGTMLPDLAAVEGLQALELFNHQLETWLRHGGQGSMADRRDYSFIWRPSIEDHEQNLGGTVEDALIDAARDTARLLVSQPEIQVPDVVVTFERRSWTLFRRLALNVLTELVSAGQSDDPKVLDLARERVVNSDNLNDLGLIHEYSMLTGALLSLLDEDAVQAWAALIEAGPVIDEDALRARLRAGVEASRQPESGANEDQGQAKASPQQPLSVEDEPAAPPTAPGPVEAILDEQVHRYRDLWRRDRLGAVRAALPPFLQERYEELARRLGEAEHSDFAAYMTTWSGPTSPATKDELSALGIDELIAYLQRWRPDSRQWPPRASTEGLARELTAAVASDPRRYAERAEDFAASGPSFSRAVLQGLEGALQGDKQFAWPSVVALCFLVAAQPDDGTEPAVDHFDEDPSWRWAQQEAASLLAMGLEPRPGELPFALSEQVLAVLVRLAESPHPTPEHEERYGGDNMDPATLALNTTRGEALRGLVAYAAWHTRYHTAEPLEVAGSPKGATASPETPLSDVLGVLDRHLDPAIDSSPAVRSVYGQHFPVLLHVAPQWARSRAVRIFGSGLPLDEQQKAAAETFLAFNRPSTPLLNALRLQYATWVQALATDTFDYQPFHSPESIPEQLATHLLLLYIWGRLELETGLLDDFFRLAPLEVRRKALANVGWQLSRTEQVIPEDVLTRLQALWETRRRAAIEAAQDDRDGGEDENPASELAAFASWFRSGRFEAQWALNELLVVLDRIGTFENLDVDVAEQLARTARTDPDVALRIYDRLVRAARQGWFLPEVAREGYPVLAAALRSHRDELIDRATQLINELGSWGLVNTREAVQAVLSSWDDEDERSSRPTQNAPG